MKERNIVNPHDKVFKAIFCHPEAATDLIKLALSKRQINQLDFSTIVLENTTFINEYLQTYFADLLFSCKTLEGNSTYVSFLIEHKSYLVPHPHVQLGQYLFEGYQNQLKHHSNLLSPIIPIVLYHGKQIWERRSFSNGFQTGYEYFKDFIPEFEYGLVNLSILPDEKIKQLKTTFAGAALLLMKHRFNRQYYLKQLGVIFEHIRSGPRPNMVFQTLLTYTFEMFKFEEQEMKNIFEAMPVDLLKEARNTKEYLMAKGMMQGLEKGLVKGKQLESLKVAIRLFKQFSQMADLQVAEISGLEVKVVSVIKFQIGSFDTIGTPKVLNGIFQDIGGLDKEELKDLIQLIQQ